MRSSPQLPQHLKRTWMQGPFCIDNLIMSRQKVCEPVQFAWNVASLDGYPKLKSQNVKLVRQIHHGYRPKCSLFVDEGNDS